MSLRSLSVAVASLLLAGAAAAAEPNALAPEEAAAGFELLFNGRDLAGWKHAGNWEATAGAIARAGAGGGIMYDVQPLPDDFELRFEWKVGPKSNSGVYYRPGQYEYQIIDNALHADGRNPRTSAAALYFALAPRVDATRPVGEWNEGRIVCQGTVVEHWLNGQRVVSFDYADPRWADDVERLRRRGGNVADRGAKLSLQDHGDPVWYRSLRLRTIPAGERVVADPTYRPAPVPPEVEAEQMRRLEAAGR
jgi:hypothetical protein